MNRNVCARCAKPVYFAERKTSLGRDWHPTCLKCSECGRVLTPGQHAEHKGNPYCHTPCYKALFGPSLLGYGSNIASPANFAKKDNSAEFGHDYYDDVCKREIYSNSRTSAAALRRQRQRRSAPPSILEHDFSSLKANGQGSNLQRGSSEHESASSTDYVDSVKTLERIPISSQILEGNEGDYPAPRVSVNGHAGNAGRNVDTSGSVISKKNRGSKCDNDGAEETPSTVRNGGVSLGHSGADTDSDKSALHDAGVNGSASSDASMTRLQDAAPELRDIVEKVESFNSHFEGKVHHQMTVEQLPNGEVKVQGPLRIYWGLSRPIQLRQCDDKPAPPIAKWRHSLCANLNDGQAPNNAASPQKLHRNSQEIPVGTQSPNRPLRGIDDSVLLSPASADDVVMRRKVRKFNTVAYRNEAPTRWKRASINGHIFNYDTSVFVPVLGSSTSVIADSSMTSPLVIQTLLEKFKVENSPGEYVLSLVTENGEQTEERLLGESERPLLQRLQLGPSNTGAKMFLKERRLQPEVTVPDSVQLPIMEEAEDEEESILPAEVEQLLILPVPVLKGIMKKYDKDEEKDVRLLKAKYERVRKKIHQRLEELKVLK